MARRSTKDRLLPIIGLTLLGVLVFLMISFNYRIIKEREGNDKKIESLRAEFKEVRERKKRLEMDLSETEDEEYIERILREDFLMKKPGEEKVIILTEEEEEEREEKKEELTGMQKLVDFLPFIGVGN